MEAQSPKKPVVEEKATDPRKVELLDASGQPIGVTVTLKDKIADDEAALGEETKEAAHLRTLAKSVSGWSKLVVGDEDYPFSQERAVALFQRFPHFAAQIERGFTKKDAA